MERLAVMEYIMHALWAVIDLFYALSLFSAFFKAQRTKEDGIWVSVLLWLATAVYSMLAVDAVSPLLVRLLAMTLLLIYLYRETSQRGLAILLMTFGILLVLEIVIRTLTESQTAVLFISMTAAKLFSILLAWFIGRYLAERLKRQEVQELELRLQRQHMEMQTESINALEQNYRQQRKITHEFEHHIQVLDDLLDAGAVTEAREYIRRLRGSRSYRVISVNSRHTVIDVILNQKYQTAQENGIKMQIKVNNLSAVALPTDSLVVILSNLLDNAIEACRRLDGYKEIDCSVLCDDGLYIAIQNTSPPVQIVDGRIDTSKPDKLGHGYGLNNVGFLLEKLGAEYTFHYSDGWFRFAAEIPN